MALIPRYFTASTRQVAEQAMQKGYLTYPAICYIKNEKIFAWITKDNEIQYIKGDKQITDVRYENDYLSFYAGDDIVYSVNIVMDDVDAEQIIKEVTDSLETSGYLKASEIIRLIDNKIGDIDNKSTVSEYINSLSYDKLQDKPITSLTGTLTQAVTISTLDDGVYKVKGQYMIGGNDTTIRNSANDGLFLVEQGESTYILSLSGRNIETYEITSDGTKKYNKYVTESWINDRGFATYNDMTEYVEESINNSFTTLVEQKIDVAIEDKIGKIKIDDIHNLF